MKTYLFCISFVDVHKGREIMNEDIYIMDIDELKELLGDNFNNCLNDINKESNIFLIQ